MPKQFAVIGLGRFGISVATTLSELGHDVIAIDNSEAAVKAVANLVTQAVQADARDEQTLRALGLRNLDMAVVAIGDDIQANILITQMLKEIGVKKVISKAMNPVHAKVLKNIGADKVISPEKDMGVRVAHNLVSFHFEDCIELSNDYSMIEIKIPAKYVNKTLRQIQMGAKYGINVMAIKKGDEVIVSPGADEVIEEGDLLIVISENKALAHLSKKICD